MHAVARCVRVGVCLAATQPCKSKTTDTQTRTNEQTTALLELGRHDAAFAAAQRACGLLPAGSDSPATAAATTEPPSSLLATTGGNKARANLCWVACLVALKKAQRATAAAAAATGPPQVPAPPPVLTVLQALLAAPLPSDGSPCSRLSGLLELATLVAEVVAPAAPALAARLLKSVLEEVLRVRACVLACLLAFGCRPASKEMTHPPTIIHNTPPQTQTGLARGRHHRAPREQARPPELRPRGLRLLPADRPPPGPNWRRRQRRRRRWRRRHGDGATAAAGGEGEAAAGRWLLCCVPRAPRGDAPLRAGGQG